jgi:phosphatidylglycerol:prolipoprotein diacylglycerol transferase
MRPILFHVFGYPVHSFGVMLVLAFLAGLAIIRQRAKKYGLDGSKLVDGALIALVFGILGARLVFILQELPYYTAHPAEILSPQFAGITSFGGIAFGLAALLIWARRQHVNGLALLDVAGPAFLIAHAIGRIGCLLNGCCYGGVCSDSLPWKIHVEGNPAWHHPAQIYDSLMNVAAFFLVLSLEKKNRTLGQTFALAMALHGLTRFIYEFWRGGTDEEVARGFASSTYWFGHITQAQVAAAVLALGGVVMYFLLDKRARYQRPLLVEEPPAPARTRDVAAV